MHTKRLSCNTSEDDLCVCVLQCVAVRLHCASMCCTELQYVAPCFSVLQRAAVYFSVLQCLHACYSALQCVAVCCSVLQCFQYFLRYVAACCSVLQSICQAVIYSSAPWLIHMHLHDSFICAMTHACAPWLIYMRHDLFICAMTHACVPYNIELKSHSSMHVYKWVFLCACCSRMCVVCAHSIRVRVCVCICMHIQFLTVGKLIWGGVARLEKV